MPDEIALPVTVVEYGNWHIFDADGKVLAICMDEEIARRMAAAMNVKEGCARA
jgi:hypothetical protein